MEKTVVLQGGDTWKRHFYQEADQRLHACPAYQKLVAVLVNDDPEGVAAALFGELGLSGNERGELRTCVNAYIQALERAPKFPELDKKMVKLDEQIRAADTKLHGEALSDDSHDVAERELQSLLYEQASLRERWTTAKLAFESLPALRTALGFTDPEMKREK